MKILKDLEISKRAKAYVKGLSVRDNAKFHRNQKIVLTVDIRNFFGTITFYQVYTIFNNIGYGKKVSSLFANLCTYKQRLPQGASTSPKLSNLVFKPIDDTIEKYSLENNIRYTRYADDLTFSGDINIGNVLFFLHTTLNKYGFVINKSKTRVMKQHSQQIVTGIVVNKRLSLPKYERKKIRQEMFFLEKFGLEEHLFKVNFTGSNYLEHLLGKISYGLHINPKDNELILNKEKLINLIEQYK